MGSLSRLPVQSGSGNPSYSINMYAVDAISDSAEYITSNTCIILPSEVIHYIADYGVIGNRNLVCSPSNRNQFLVMDSSPDYALCRT